MLGTTVLAFLKHSWHIWQPARHFPQMTVRTWLGTGQEPGPRGGGLVAAAAPRALDLVSSRSLGLRELMGAKAPLEKMVGKGPARPPV